MTTKLSNPAKCSLRELTGKGAQHWRVGADHISTTAMELGYLGTPVFPLLPVLGRGWDDGVRFHVALFHPRWATSRRITSKTLTHPTVPEAKAVSCVSKGRFFVFLRQGGGM